MSREVGLTANQRPSVLANCSRRNALRLRETNSPLALSHVLFDVWKPIYGPWSPFVPTDDGAVDNLDVSELVFFSDNICKKLISTIRYKETSKETKIAAIDVFTWLCSHPELLKSLFIATDEIIDWVFALARDRDVPVASTGLRGLLALAKSEHYVFKLSQHKALITLMDELDHKSEIGRRCVVQIFMLYHYLMTKAEAVPSQEGFLRKLLQLADTGNFTSLAEQYWSARCIQTAVTFSRRENGSVATPVIKKLIESMSTEAFDKLMNEEVGTCAYIMETTDPTNAIAFDDLILEQRSYEWVVQMTASLGRSHALALLVRIANRTPDEFLVWSTGDIWDFLCEVLETGAKAEESQVLNIIKAISTVKTDKRQLPCKDGGTKLLLTLKQRLSEQTVEAMKTIWTQFGEVAKAFDEAEISQWLLSKLFGEVLLPVGTLYGMLEQLLLLLLKDTGPFGDKVHDQMTTTFKFGMATAGVDVLMRQLFGHWMRFFAMVTSDCDAYRTVHFLIEEGYENIVSYTPVREHEEPMIWTVVGNLLATPILCIPDTNYVLKRLVLMVSLVPTTAWKWSVTELRSHFLQTYNAATQEDLSNLPGLCLPLSAISNVSLLLGGTIAGRPPDQRFVGFLLHVLVKIGLERLPEAAGLNATSTRRALFTSIGKWTRELAHDKQCSELLLRGLVLTVGPNAHKLVEDSITMRETRIDVSVANLWSLCSRYGMSNQFAEEDKKRLLEYLRELTWYQMKGTTNRSSSTRSVGTSFARGPNSSCAPADPFF